MFKFKKSDHGHNHTKPSPHVGWWNSNTGQPDGQTAVWRSCAAVAGVARGKIVVYIRQFSAESKTKIILLLKTIGWPRGAKYPGQQSRDLFVFF